MAFDFKKEYREFYLPKNTPELVRVPRANYVAVRGQGTLMRRAAPTRPPSACCTRWHTP